MDQPCKPELKIVKLSHIPIPSTTTMPSNAKRSGEPEASQAKRAALELPEQTLRNLEAYIAMEPVSKDTERVHTLLLSLLSLPCGGVQRWLYSPLLALVV